MLDKKYAIVFAIADFVVRGSQTMALDQQTTSQIINLLTFLCH
jgi:hypothetical protein